MEESHIFQTKPINTTPNHAKRSHTTAQMKNEIEIEQNPEPNIRNLKKQTNPTKNVSTKIQNLHIRTKLRSGNTRNREEN